MTICFICHLLPATRHLPPATCYLLPITCCRLGQRKKVLAALEFISDALIVAEIEDPAVELRRERCCMCGIADGGRAMQALHNAVAELCAR